MNYEEIIEKLEEISIKFKTYNDYPQSATNNAKKVLRWRDEHGDEVKGMTRVGWTRASQLARKQKISRDTIARMASFKRHEKNAEIKIGFRFVFQSSKSTITEKEVSEVMKVIIDHTSTMNGIKIPGLQ